MLSSTPAETRVAEPDLRPPLVVDLDGTLIRSDLLDETFAAAFFRRPLLTLLVVLRALLAGRARLKEALGRLGDKRAMDALVHAVDDEDTMVQDAAFDAIKKLSDTSFGMVI